MPELVVEAPESIFDAPRTLLADEFCEWLAKSDAVQGLPDAEVVVTLTRGSVLPARLGAGAVGCFVVSNGPFLNRRWEIALAYGGRYRDEHDVAAWLVSIPHELLHLVDFVRTHGGAFPADVGVDRLRACGQGDRNEAEEDRIEHRARQIVDRFVAEHPTRCRQSDLLAPARRSARSPRGH